MSQLIWLSHTIKNATPLYGGKGSIFFTPDKQINLGNSSNTMIWTMPNHCGTHVDCPAHFFAAGESVDKFPPDYWIFNNVYLAEVENVKGAWLISDELLDNNIPKSTELLLIKTGFEHYRNQPFYWEENPGLSPHLAMWLRKTCPNIRAIGVDFISISSFKNRETGRMAHQAFLESNNSENPILLFEDMSLKNATNNLKRVFSLPVRVENADGAPCTIIGELES